MRTEYCLCHVLGVTPESNMKFVHTEGILSPRYPGSLI